MPKLNFGLLHSAFELLRLMV